MFNLSRFFVACHFFLPLFFLRSAGPLHLGHRAAFIAPRSCLYFYSSRQIACFWRMWHMSADTIVAGNRHAALRIVLLYCRTNCDKGRPIPNTKHCFLGSFPRQAPVGIAFASARDICGRLRLGRKVWAWRSGAAPSQDFRVRFHLLVFRGGRLSLQTLGLPTNLHL